MTTTSCPQCGAKFEAGDTACIDRFNATQLKEVENPATYYSVHHISVPCYMLQHNAYSRRGWIEVYAFFTVLFMKTLTPRRRVARCARK